MLPSPSLMYPAKGLRQSLRAWRSNERNSFLAVLSIGPFDQFGLDVGKLCRVNVMTGSCFMAAATAAPSL